MNNIYKTILTNTNRLKYLYLVIALIFVGIIPLNATNITISKTNNAPNPIPSGQPFTYTITYGWSGGAPGTLYITDTIPSTLEVISAAPGGPVSSISGNTVTFEINGLNLPSGSGTVQINARFKPGVTCEGETACNVAAITDEPERDEWVYSSESCVTAAAPENKWQFKKELFAGCAIDNEVIFRISITDPTGSDVGGLNLTNINLEDMLPANAVITDVTNWWSGPVNTTSNGTNWIQLTGGPTDLQVSPWWQFYVTYVTVEFPSSDFSVGQTVENIAKLEFQTPCDNETQTWLDTARVELCEGVQDATLHKSLNMGLYFPNNSFYTPHFTPGCCGTYRLWYKNTGTLPQNNLVMEDEVPGEVDVNNIYTSVYTGHTPVTLEIYTWNNGSCSTVPDTTITYNSTGTFTESNLPPEICRMKWTYGGTIDLNQNVFNRFDVCVRDTNFKDGSIVIPGQTIVNNQVEVSGTNLQPISVTHDKLVDETSPKILATKLFVGECNDNCQVNPGGPYQPGDTVRYRLAVANAGGLDATAATITDNLSSGLSYLGNDTYYYGSFNSLANMYNPPCCSLTTSVPSEIGGTITTPSVGDTNLVWDFPLLPARCDGAIEYFLIEFDVLISEDPPALAGQHPNNFDFDADNINTVTSNNAYLTVNAVAQIQALKEVREQGLQGAWNQLDTIPQGGDAEYRITVTNTGNTPLMNICLLDIMPWNGDITVLPNYNPRGSTFDLPFDPNNGNITITPSGYSTEYNDIGSNQSQNPSRTNICNGFCGISDPSGAVTGNFVSNPTNTYSYKISANSGINLAPGNSLNAIVPVNIPINTQINEIACNSFAVQATPQAMPSVCLSAESNNACIEVSEKSNDSPCFRIGEYTLDCLYQNEKGNWVYELNIDITNNTSAFGTIQIQPNQGNIFNINPNNIPALTTTNVTATYETSQAPGGVCFDIEMYEDGSDNMLCDSTICLEYDICEDKGCECPYDIKIERQYASQSSGNAINTSALFNINAGIRNIRATIVEAQVTENCFWGGSNTYNSPAVINNASNWGTISYDTLSPNSIEWNNEECPDLNNFAAYLNIDVPNAPGFFCFQTVKLCVRYEFTDCECTICDTTICYEIRRKRIPIIVWGELKPVKISGGIIKETKHSQNYDEFQAEENDGYASIGMTSYDEGKLLIDNPEGDEYTHGINIHSIEIQTYGEVEVTDISSDNWSNSTPTDNGLIIQGLLKPGEQNIFDIQYNNPNQTNKWVNNIIIGYSIENATDTLYGGLELVSRVPDAEGGDIIENVNPGNNVENARTFALKFTNSNKTQESISKITLKVYDATILAAGPGLEDNQFEMQSMKTANDEITLLASQPEKHIAINSEIPAGGSVGPIYLTLESEDETSVYLNYVTYAENGDMITDTDIELTNPVLSVNTDNGFINHINTNIYPNPSQNEVNFKFRLNKSENVSINIRNLSGKLITNIINNRLLLEGEHTFNLNTQDIPSGTYYYTIEAGKESHTEKFVITK